MPESKRVVRRPGYLPVSRYGVIENLGQFQGRIWPPLRNILLEAWEDDIPGESAKVAYYFFLSLFPSLIAIFALTGILGGEPTFDLIMNELRGLLPGAAADNLKGFVQEVTGRSRPGMLSLGLLLTLWSASNIFTALAGSLNTVYDLTESRTWWRKRVLALTLLITGMLTLVLGSASVLAGPELIRVLQLKSYWNLLRWPLALVLLTVLMWLIYYILPNRDQSDSRLQVLLGAIVGTALWLGGTIGFRVYIEHFADYSRTYGFVGGIIVLLLWLYVTAVAVLLGGEVAATLGQRKRRRGS